MSLPVLFKVDDVFRARSNTLAPSSTVDVREFMASLESLRRRGASSRTLLQRAVKVLVAEQTNYAHPGYLGLYNSAPGPLAMDVSHTELELNAQVAGVSESPLLHCLEEELMREVGRAIWSGHPRAGGLLTSGGAMSNLLGVVAALESAFSVEWRDRGLRELPPIRVYTSELCHASVRRAMRVVGLGDQCLRSIPVDAINGGALMEAVHSDRSRGYVPLMFAATLGDTQAGESDCTVPLAAELREAGLHIHVDAAWAGVLTLVDERRHLVEALGAADSVTIDMHKWPGLPFGTSMFVVRDVGLMKLACTVQSDYADVGDADFADHGIEWSRRSRALSVWWRLFLFRDSFLELVQRQFLLAARLREGLVARTWSIVNETELPVVCFTRRGLSEASAKDLVASLLERNILVSTWTKSGKVCLRVAIINGNTTQGTIDAILAGLDQLLRG